MGLIHLHRLIKKQRPWVSFAGFILRLVLALAMVMGGIWLLLCGLTGALDSMAEFLHLLLP